MKKCGKFTVLALVVMVVFSCGREKLTPLYQPMTVNELKNDRPVNFSYEVDENQIDEYARNAGKFPLFGKLFQAIARVLANATISNQGGHELELSEVDVDLSSLSSIDFDLIQYINFDSLTLSVRDAKNKDSLDFIQKIEIYGKLDNSIEGLPVDTQGYARLVYFDRAEDQLECNGRCIKLNIAPVDWRQLLKTNKMVHLQPKLIINSVPLSTMKLAGSIDFSVKFNLGF
ncbi:MAG: hypothetical protein ACXVLQ_01580 [Bacteriovorax sp.]